MNTLDAHRALVVGFGSIGRRHLSNLRSRPFCSIGVVSSSAEIGAVEDLGGAIPLFRSLSEAIPQFRPSFAIISNASPAHVKTARQLADVGVHLYIEKPLSDHLEGVQLLAADCEARGLTTMVAYTLRFLPVLQRTESLLRQGAVGRPLFVSADVGQYLPDWRPSQDYRKSVSALRALGGGALLELSHEIDYVRWFLGNPDTVFAMTGRSGLIDVDVEDSADLLLSYADGTRARIHQDFLERGKNRRCRIVGSTGTLETDLIAGSVSLKKAGDPEKTIETPQFSDPYKASLSHFLDCIISRQTTRIPLSDGIATLAVIDSARRAAVHQRAVLIAYPSVPAQKAS